MVQEYAHIHIGISISRCAGGGVGEGGGGNQSEVTSRSSKNSFTLCGSEQKTKHETLSSKLKEYRTAVS